MIYTITAPTVPVSLGARRWARFIVHILAPDGRSVARAVADLDELRRYVSRLRNFGALRRSV